ncbi:MAG: hypothetical protein GWN01_09300 [Nitrosopumilaceae archaeon]|nr:hypothetical protein [Nitrosopumilaceae archaeon]NIU87805.1 hypothetical protein [Nitrosopumilaceae archaeon]NIV65187.1 hypothetical protein [Nitrosopumilaceae archaeon]NIX61703.1 hypothetical protein [Nitrosopumilaceae archaeon]
MRRTKPYKQSIQDMVPLKKGRNRKTGEPITTTKGRPRKIQSPQEFDRRVDNWARHCLENRIPMTRTGLCLALGLNSQKSLENYADDPDYTPSVSYAKLLVEHFYERQLSTSRVAGAIFALSNMGWSNQQYHRHAGPDGGPIQSQNIVKIDMTKLDDDTLEKLVFAIERRRIVRQSNDSNTTQIKP